MNKKKHIDFKGQNLYISIDVHKNSWFVTTRINGYRVESYSSDPSPKQLSKHVRDRYPGANYYCVYEAGFSGFWIQRELEKMGIRTIIVNPADVPTKDKEKKQKTDRVDSQKLARELEMGNLEGIYVPEVRIEQIRSLIRLRYQLVTDRSRVKNRIKSYLAFTGKQIPKELEAIKWSVRLNKYLIELEFEHRAGKEILLHNLEYLESLNQRIKQTENQLKAIIEEDKKYKQIVDRIDTVPGIGFISAITFWAEIVDINRFKKFDQLCSFVGLVPSVHSSGEKQVVLGLQKRQNKYLKSILIESAWVAVRKDPVLMKSYGSLIRRMQKQKAIIKIAKKLLSRLRYVWCNNEDYQNSIAA